MKKSKTVTLRCIVESVPLGILLFKYFMFGLFLTDLAFLGYVLIYYLKNHKIPTNKYLVIGAILALIFFLVYYLKQLIILC